ncbi:MAG: hypothetical protein ABIF71_10390 [Planctomycetota bacterium]
MDRVLTLAGELDAAFIARTAIYCREKGFMKDMPALLCAGLGVKGPELPASVFERVIDNSRMIPVPPGR